MGQERGRGTPSRCCPIDMMWLPQGLLPHRLQLLLGAPCPGPSFTPASLGVMISSHCY